MLYIVGIGPGKEDLLTLRAVEVLKRADVVLGHKSYVNRILNVINRKAEVLESSMGKELERVKIAVELSKEKEVCLVSGGDPSIYGMTSLVLEYLMKNGIEIKFEVVPGITALSAASPLLGCPVSGDHCVVSLSDLLTPWECIERRLASALIGDFVVVIYNPSSRRRKKNLEKAMELVLRLRGNVPVGCVRNAERDGTEVWITSAKGIIEMADKIDMHTILFISSHDTIVEKYMLTPRGYSNKYTISEDCVKEASGAKTEEGISIAKKSASLAKKMLLKFEGVEKFVAERCLVATADPSVLSILRFNRTEEVMKGLKSCEKIIVDVEMVKAGLRADKEVLVASKLGEKSKKTVVSSGIRKLEDEIDSQFVAIGNSPSALDELCNLIEEGVKPSAIVATPVGFTNASPAKDRLMEFDLPYITTKGARGGSTLCVAIVNALLAYR